MRIICNRISDSKLYDKLDLNGRIHALDFRTDVDLEMISKNGFKEDYIETRVKLFKEISENFPLENDLWIFSTIIFREIYTEHEIIIPLTTNLVKQTMDKTQLEDKQKVWKVCSMILKKLNHEIGFGSYDKRKRKSLLKIYEKEIEKKIDPISQNLETTQKKVA